MQEEPFYDDQESGEATKQAHLDVARIRQQLNAMKDQIDGVLRLLNGTQTRIISREHPQSQVLDTGERIIEGVFDGQSMIGDDGGEYHVPPNYASKSKLVEGDRLKLTITGNGTFLYKQIEPIDREQVVGELAKDTDTNQWIVVVDGKPYKILTASVTFYKGKASDDVTILIPSDGAASWGAVVNIIPK